MLNEAGQSQRDGGGFPRGSPIEGQTHTDREQAAGCWGGRMEVRVMGTDFQFCKMKRVLEMMVVMVAQQPE